MVGIIKLRYSEPRFRKYVEGYSFLSFARKFGDKYGKKLMDTATKTGIDAAKTTSKRVVQKTAEVNAVIMLVLVKLVMMQTKLIKMKLKFLFH